MIIKILRNPDSTFYNFQISYLDTIVFIFQNRSHKVMGMRSFIRTDDMKKLQQLTLLLRRYSAIRIYIRSLKIQKLEACCQREFESTSYPHPLKMYYFQALNLYFSKKIISWMRKLHFCLKFGKKIVIKNFVFSTYFRQHSFLLYSKNLSQLSFLY